MLSQDNRFHGLGSLNKTYKFGKTVRLSDLSLKYMPNHRKNTRVSVVVSKKIEKTAVGRNRIRRRIYSIIETTVPDITQPTDLIISVFSSQLIKAPHNELHSKIKNILEKANLV